MVQKRLLLHVLEWRWVKGWDYLRLLVNNFLATFKCSWWILSGQNCCRRRPWIRCHMWLIMQQIWLLWSSRSLVIATYITFMRNLLLTTTPSSWLRHSCDIWILSRVLISLLFLVVEEHTEADDLGIPFAQWHLQVFYQALMLPSELMVHVRHDLLRRQHAIR